ncbi:hypothetical protein KDA_30540 [Dictyobacter alpinus]|uniref:Pentapeptide repeat-containing protein n=1 Tax=Dictyobacter alpinus TaxID=2014873 RepID=A0A402B8E9_9CHLR|nr:pentapeptide repeat-containing protein [Dictyobacter alpinus]GCE27570.1 hypothetical protein KDA_30540 [Dictyobacter alpinus]
MQHIKILEQGVEVWNKWRQDNPAIRPKLIGVDLSGQNLSRANFNSADLQKANLRGANLLFGHLNDADLRKADLSGAELGFFDVPNKINLSQAIMHRCSLSSNFLQNATIIGTDLSNTDLTGAYLSGKDLRDTNFSNTTLRKASLFGANLTNAKLVNADLREAMLCREAISEVDLEDLEFEDREEIENNIKPTDLTGTDLTGANLSGVHLNQVIFREATLCGSDLSRANLFGACLYHANLTGANLTKAILVETDLTKSTLTDCRVYGASVWDTKLEEAKQINLIVTPPDRPAISVDDLEIAQFMFLLFEHQKLRDALNSIINRGVLLLGGFDNGGIEILHAMADKLRQMKYLPIIFEFARPEHRNLRETVSILAGLSRFVIAEISGPSVPAELENIASSIHVSIVPIIQESVRPFSMFIDFLVDYKVTDLVRYKNKEHLLEVLESKVIDPAESKFEERKQKLLRMAEKSW